jgi:5-methylcytosine-specific restriction endonuclease McrA
LGRCPNMLVWGNRGIRKSSIGAWETNHRVRVESGGSDVLSNCEILCWDCHSQTL